jgi:hypothetical protein
MKINRCQSVVLFIILMISCQNSDSSNHYKISGFQNGILFINDQPFIPTGVYFWPDISAPTGWDPFEDVARYGLNALVAYYEYVKPDREITNQPSIQELREGCERLVIYYFIGAPNGDVLENKSDAELQALFAATSREVLDSPYFLGWMFDEPILNGMDLSLMERTVAAIRQYLGEQLIWLNFAPLDARWSDPQWPDMATYAQLGDIVGFDFYPVDMDLPWPGYISKSRIEDFGWYVDQAVNWVSVETPVWMIQQGWRKGDLQEPPTTSGRRPDSVETRFMSYQALVHGATGLFYFTGSRLGGAIPFGDPTWDVYIRETVAAIQSLTPVLASFDPVETITASSSSIRVLTRKRAGKTTLIAVRESDGEPLTVKFQVPDSRITTLNVVGEERQIQVIDHSFSDQFDRYDVHVYTRP